MACLTTTGASAQAASNISGFKATADSMIEATQDALDDISKNLHLPIISIGVGQLGTFAYDYREPASAPAFNTSINLPAFTIPAIDYSTIDPDINIGDAPVNEAIKPAFNEPLKPSDLDTQPPGDAPTVGNPILPDVPVLDDIADPFQFSIAIPQAPNVTFPEFTAIPPDSSGLVVPGDTFHWSETDYDSTILQEIQTKVSDFLNGSVGIPDIIWDSIWDRAAEKEDKAGLQLIQQTTEEWGARGFSLPQGVQTARIQEANIAILNNRSTLSRDIAEKQAVHEIENLKFAVQQGIALENMVGGWYQQKVARALEAAKFSYQATIQLFEASVNLYSTQLQLYQTEAQVYKSLLESAVLELEAYKVELEGQALVNNINKQNVDIYVAKTNALRIKIDLYNSELQAAKTQVEVDQARISAFKTEVDAFAAIVAAKSQEYDAYISQLKAEETRIGVYDTEIKAFATEVGAYKTTVDAKVTEKSLEYKNSELQLQEFAAKLEHYNNSVKAEMSKLEASVATFKAESESYGISVTNETKRLDTGFRTEELNVKIAELGTQANIQSGNLYLDSSKSETALSVKAAESTAQINSQIGSAAMAAITVGASISDSASSSCDTEG